LGDFIVFNGAMKRTFHQDATRRKPMATETKFYGNGHTARRLVSAIQSSSTLTEAARRIGSADLFLMELKRYTDRRDDDNNRKAA
jgi:hypothetical protein